MSATSFRIGGRYLTALMLVVTAIAAAPTAASAAPAKGKANRYVVNLQSSTKPIRLNDHPAARTLGGSEIYVAKATIRRVLWYRLRLGYFHTKAEARSALRIAKKGYPDAWIDKARASEVKVAHASALTKPAATPATDNNTRSAELMRTAREKMLEGKYAAAVDVYTNVLALKVPTYSQEAQELLGVARERNGQMKRAQKEYEAYLRLYPDGEDAERVRQRLMGLVTATAKAPAPLRKTSSGDTKGDPQWKGFGSVAVYYRWADSTAAGTTTTDESALTTYLDYSTRRRGETYDVRARFTGQYNHDMEGDKGDEGRLRKFYVEALHSGRGFSASFGRQSRSGSGVFGKFDGGTISKPLSSITHLNLIAGVPVAFGSEDRIDDHKKFLGASLDVGTLAGAWDFNTFYIRQEVDGITDREAVGGEVHYRRDGRTLFTLLDYDIFYSSVNMALATAGWTGSDGTSVNLLLDYRKAPILTTSNALISQQGVTSIDELLQSFTESEVHKLAKDRTARSRSATISASKPLTKKLQLMGNVTLSSFGSTPASGGVEGTQGTGWDSYSSIQLVASELLGHNDTTIFGTRYSDTDNADTVSFTLNHRYPVNRRLRLNPRLRIDLRNSQKNGDETKLSASLRVNHKYSNDLSLEAEVGNEWGEQKTDTLTGESERRFLFLGFRKDF